VGLDRRASIRGARVLVAEDEDAIRLLVTSVLAYELGVHAVGAPDGRAALAMVAERLPALVITDLRMPGLDGYELTRRLKSDPTTRAIPVVAMTAAGDRAAAAAAGCDGFLAKPFDVDELVGLASRLLMPGRPGGGSPQG
jgi:two-component system cell cycle response regulator DivK